MFLLRSEVNFSKIVTGMHSFVLISFYDKWIHSFFSLARERLLEANLFPRGNCSSENFIRFPWKHLRWSSLCAEVRSGLHEVGYPGNRVFKKAFNSNTLIFWQCSLSDCICFIRNPFPGKKYQAQFRETIKEHAERCFEIIYSSKWQHYFPYYGFLKYAFVNAGPGIKSPCNLFFIVK